MRLKHLLLGTITAAVLLSAASASALSTKRIQAVSFANSTTGYLAGGYSPRTGFLSVTTDGGVTWRATRMANRWFYGVTGATSGWGLSDYSNYAYVSTNLGSTWVAKGPVVGHDGVNLAAMETLSGGRTVAVGQRTGATAPTGEPQGDLGVIASSTNGGASWSTQYEGPKYPPAKEGDPWGSTKAGIVAIDGTSAGSVAWAVGNEWDTSGTSFLVKKWLLYRSADGGVTWALQKPPTHSGFPLTAVAAGSASKAYAAAGNRGFLRTLDGGSTWTSIVMNRATNIPTMYTNGLAVVGDSTVVAVGGGGSADGAALVAVNKSSGDSNKWTYVNLPAFATLRDIEILSSTTWIAVGDNETILRTTDGGASWKAISPGLTPPTVTMSSPLSGFSLSSPVTIAGSSSDVGVGVDRVLVRIARPNNTYWNGSYWTSTVTWLPVSTINHYKNWSLNWTPEANALSGGTVTITARAVDGMGQIKDLSVQSQDTRKPTALSSSSKSKTLAYGGTGTLSGYLKSNGVAVPGQTVILQKSTDGTKFSDTSVKSVTSSSGYFKLSAKPKSKAYYRARYAGSLVYAPATPTTKIAFTPKAFLSKKPWSSSKTIYRGKTYRYYSSLKPRHKSGTGAVKLQFQRYSKGKYRAYKTVTAYAYNYSSYSRVKGSYKIPYKGKWRVRAYHKDAGHAATYSGWLYKTVK